MQNKSRDLQMARARGELPLSKVPFGQSRAWVKKILFIAGLAALAFYGGMYGAGAAQILNGILGSSTSPADIRGLIDKSGGGFRVSKEFSYVQQGYSPLRGAVIVNDAGTPIIAWVLEGRLVLGNVYDEMGADLTDAAANAHGAKHPIAAATDLLRSDTPADVLAWANIQGMPGVLIAGSTSNLPIELYVVTWSACPTCKTLDRFLKEVQPTLPFLIKICPIGGRRAVDRDAFALLGEDENGPRANIIRESLHKTHDIVEAALGKAKVPCMFWLDPETGKVRYLAASNLNEVKQVIIDISAKIAP